MTRGPWCLVGKPPTYKVVIYRVIDGMEVDVLVTGESEPSANRIASGVEVNLDQTEYCVSVEPDN